MITDGRVAMKRIAICVTIVLATASLASAGGYLNQPSFVVFGALDNSARDGVAILAQVTPPTGRSTEAGARAAASTSEQSRATTDSRRLGVFLLALMVAIYLLASTGKPR